MERSYIAFISYKHTEYDAAIAKRVHKLIENYVIPKSMRKDSKKLGVAFRDEEELPVSSNLTESIRTALDASQYLIVICSPEAKESPWVAREVNYFLKNHDVGSAFVVLVRGEPQDVFPYELTHVMNGKTGEYEEVEPLAMDVRADSIGVSLKKTRIQMKKLYAAMLGCSYDSLVQREKARRMKHVAALAAVCMLFAGSFMGMLFAKNQALEQKNKLLSEAIELALSRESELLATEADEALLNGDTAAAIRYASDALYSEEIQRPYNPHAERVLFSAMDVLQKGSSVPLLSRIALEHHAPIQSMAYSSDGMVVYVIDSYGMVSGFDSSTGELIWSVKLRENPNTLFAADPQLWYDGEGGALCCYYSEILFGLDALSGKTVWETELENHVEAGFEFDEAERKLMFIERRYVFNPDEEMGDHYEFCLDVFSIQDGKLLQRIPVMNASNSSIVKFSGYNGTDLLGVFAGSDRLAGIMSISENDVSKVQLYTVDLSENTVSFVENEIFHSVYDHIGTAYMGNDRLLVLSNREETGLNMQCFDLNAGAILWEKSVLSGEYIQSDANCRMIAGSQKTVIAVGVHMFCIVNDTGEVYAYTELGAEIVDLYWLTDGLFGFVLADGCCAAGWWNQYGIIYTGLADLPETSEMIRYNNGFIQASVQDNKIEGFLLASVKEGGGSVTYLSEDRCTAYTATVMNNPELPAPIAVESESQAAISAGKYIDVNRHGTILLGPVKTDEEYALNVLDAANHVFTTINVEYDYGMRSLNRFYLTEDNQNVIACSDDGYIDRISADGQIEPLAKGDTVTLAVVGDMSYVNSQCSSDAARLESDGRIIAASCDGQKITAWMDGMNEEILQIPEEICWQVTDGPVLRRIFRVGENGLLVLSDFASEESIEVGHFAVYDIFSGKWKRIEDAAHGASDRMIAFGQKSPVYAVCDEDMHIRIYDYNASEPVHAIDIERPAISVRSIGMLLDDRYLYVVTEDGQFMIYDIGTHEMVFWTVANGIYSAEDMDIWFDPENNRLYVRISNDFMCIDVLNWEQLFRESYVEFFSPVQKEVYISEYDLETSATKLKAIPIPSTAEMVEIARKALG